MRPLLCCLALCLGPGCRPPVPATPDAPAGDGETTATTRRPLPSASAPRVGALLEEASSVAQAAGLTGASVPSPPSFGARVPGVQRITGRWHPQPDLPPHKTPYLVDRIEVIFKRPPQATVVQDPVLGDALRIAFTTRAPTERAAAYAGMRLAEDGVALPRYREYHVEPKPGRRTAHAIQFGLAELLDPRTDVDGIRARGYGDVEWQVEVPYPDSGSTVLYSGRLSVNLEDGAILAAPTVLLGPLVHQVTETSAVISIETDVPVVAVVAGANVVAQSTTPGTRHEIVLEDLPPGHRVPYRVAIADGRHTSVTPERTLTTLRPGPLTIAILSDSRSGVGPGMTSYNAVNASVLHGLFVGAYRRGAEAIFFPGDLIDGYVAHVDDYDWQLRAWLSVVEGVHGQIPVYTGMGNHEALVDVWSDGMVLDKRGPDSAEARFAALMVNPPGAPPPETNGAPPYDETVYSVDIKGVHVVMLNTNYWYTRQPGDPRLGGKGNREGVLMEGQLSWLASDLEAAHERNVEHIVVLGHEPAFPVGGHAKDGMWWNNAIPEVNAMRERFWRLLAEHDVVAYVAGDEHNYSRTSIGPETVPGAKRSVHSIISGGAGAPYYALAPPAQYADRVQAFSGEQHFTLWTFTPGENPRLQVYGLTGNLIEDVTLD